MTRTPFSRVPADRYFDESTNPESTHAREETEADRWNGFHLGVCSQG